MLWLLGDTFVQMASFAQTPGQTHTGLVKVFHGLLELLNINALIDLFSQLPGNIHQFIKMLKNLFKIIRLGINLMLWLSNPAANDPDITITFQPELRHTPMLEQTYQIICPALLMIQ